MKQMGDKYFKSDSDQCLPLANQVTYKFSNSISVNISNLIPAIKFKLEHIFTIHLFPLEVGTQLNFKTLEMLQHWLYRSSTKSWARSLAVSGRTPLMPSWTTRTSWWWWPGQTTRCGSRGWTVPTRPSWPTNPRPRPRQCSSRYYKKRIYHGQDAWMYLRIYILNFEFDIVNLAYTQIYTFLCLISLF